MVAQNGQLSASEISQKFEISAPAVSQHLKVLREAEILRMEKRAQQRIYSLNAEGIEEVWDWLNQMRAFWTSGFDRMEDVLKTRKKTKKT